jgi:hypothetical protein
METRRKALIRAMPILLFTVVFGALIVFLALRTVSVVRRSQVVVASYEAVLPACDGQAVKGSPSYNAGSDRLHPIVALRRSGSGWAPDPEALPAAWTPDEPAAAELALCLEAALPLSAPACDDEVTLAVYGYTATARLVATATGETVSSTVLTSAPDPGCWNIESEGAPLRNEQLQEWLMGFVAGGETND